MEYNDKKYLNSDSDKLECNIILCPNCRTNNICGSKVCIFCGKDLPEGILKNSKPNDSKKEYIKCDLCGTLNPLSASYCRGCQESFEGKEIRKKRIEDIERRLGLSAKKSQKLISCPYCGALNSPENEYCIDCQKSINSKKENKNKRNIEVIEERLSLLSKDNSEYKKCDNCGALNTYGSIYCKDCQLKLIYKEKESIKDVSSNLDSKMQEAEAFIRCEICGALNNSYDDYCNDCKMPLKKLIDEDKGEHSLGLEHLEYSEDDFVVCESCGGLNPKDGYYCKFCQSLVDSSKVVKEPINKREVVLKFPKNERYVFCDNCGACCEKGSIYCKDCMTLLPKE